MIQRLIVRLTRDFYRVVWKIISFRAPKPIIETLYDDENGSMVFACHGPVYIDPAWGYIITEKGHILEESMQYNFAHGKRPFAISIPSPFHFFKAIKKKENIIEKETVVSLRHYWEWNYYHFYFDVLGKLELLQKAGIADTMPLVIAKYADEISFVRPLIERGKFCERNWLIPTTEFIKAEKVIFCQTHTAYKERILYILDALEIEAAQKEDERRIYLSRSGTRRLTNLDEARPIFEKYSFEIADSGNMSIDDQIALFSNVRYIVANHGAGTTNILFRGDNPLSLLEIHHEQYVNFDHKQICDEMGYAWDELEGKKGAGTAVHANFTVDLEQLEQKIIALLNT